MSDEKQIVEVNASSGGVIALLVTFFFGPVGAFFSYWLIAKQPLLTALLKSFIWFILILISSLLLTILIGYILLPVVWIAMLVYVYKASSKTQIVMK